MKRTVFLLLALPLAAHADIWLPAILSDHMVLQRGAKTPLWGKADPGEKVTATFQGVTASTVADGEGKWRLDLDLRDCPAGPADLAVEGKSRRVVADVLVGEVWLASGQSNMERPLRLTQDADAETAVPADPQLRQFTVQRADPFQPQDDCKGSWVAAGPDTAAEFSAVARYFGKALRRELGVPVGLIGSYWGGTPVEAWTSSEALDADPDLKAAKEKVREDARQYPARKEAWIAAFGAWLDATGRADKPAADISRFTGLDGGAAWTALKLPGSAAVPGAVWVRKIVEIGPADAGKVVHLQLGPIEGFETVYWNGKLLKRTTCRDYPGDGYVRYAEVPADAVRAGGNVLAVRVFSPAVPAKFPGDLKTGTQSLDGEWETAVETALPPLSAADLASVPALEAPLPLSNVACTLFNGMIHPIIPYGIRGAIWYQGENNVSRAWQYRTAFPLLIRDWRARWSEGDFPFYFCQLANNTPKWPHPTESGWSELREAQSSALALPHTGEAVLIDLGEAGDIHPRDKKDVGERLARLALARDYGKDVAWSGPVYEKMAVDGGRVRLDFAHADGGLVARPLGATYLVKSETGQTAPLVRNSPDSDLEGFAACGADRKWVWADAKIDGTQVVVWSDKVPEPIAVRYAWGNNPTGNLYNGAGLPASPFRTDDFPALTKDRKYPR